MAFLPDPFYGKFIMLVSPVWMGRQLVCFWPFGQDRVFAELTLEEKNRISHRGKALQEARKLLGA